jgi:hypothetical protein
MIFQEYRELTKRTLPDLGSTLITPLINSIHMGLGMCSEIEELYTAIENKDWVNVGEELSDGNWYATNYCNIHDINPSCSPFTPSDLQIGVVDIELLNAAVKDLVKVISKLQDLDKKLLAYGKYVEHNARKEAIEEYFTILHVAYQLAGVDAEQSMQNNIDKLAIRFPDKFTTYLANNRNLAAERIELEKGY